ncbi:MAG: patatin-like phospholipase/acyl hydrolase [Oceanospirillaceae bacterium]|jgi:patatin-like phospholipase/acyl hydrolase
MTKKINILSIDGGGIRGIIPGTILNEIEKRIQAKEGPDKRLVDYVDFVAGTSTGGILACGMLMPDKNGKPKYSMKEVVDIYLDRGDEIFDISTKQKIRSLGGLRDEKYDNAELKDALKDKFGDTWLKDLIKPCLIPAYDTKRRQTKFFNQEDAKTETSRNFLVREVAQATGAAPTYFEAARIKSELSVPYPLIDGGVFANNPAMCAYAEARSMDFPKKDLPTPSAKDMFMLSIGTGSVKKSYSHSEVKDYGLVEWIKPLIDIMMSANSETVHYQLRMMFDTVVKKGDTNKDYIRIDPDLLSASSEMDDASEENMNHLREAGLDYVASNKNQIDAIVKKLIDNS